MKVLLVDDDETSSEFFRRRLEKRGIKVELVHSGQDALDYIKSEPKTLILLDIIMPGLDGVEVLKKIRESAQSVELPVIMMSAHGEASKIVECLELGANDYIAKPVNIDIAIARIKTQMTSVRLHQDSIKKGQLEALNAMITTYNHQINNPPLDCPWVPRVQRR